MSAAGASASLAGSSFLEAAREIVEAGGFSRFQNLPDVEGLFST